VDFSRFLARNIRFAQGTDAAREFSLSMVCQDVGSALFISPR